MTAVRELRWSDIDELVVLEQQLFPGDAWSARTWWSELAARPARWYVVASDEQRCVGYAGLALAGDVADVMTIGVAPATRGRGLGQRLLGMLVDKAQEAGAEALMLEVRADNEAARKLYGRNGFEQISVRRRYYQPGDVDALVLRLMLTGKDRV